MPHRLIRYLYHGLVLLGLLLSQGTRAGVEITYIHNDALGTPVAGTDAQGRVKWRAHYQPWGGEVLGERQPTGLRAGYTGHREDAATGLTYMGARYYSPRLGRFMGVDPAGVREGSVHSFNRYAYANNNPYTYVDPDGENPKLFIDFGLNVALNIVATGKPQLANAVRDTVRGALNPLRTVKNIARLARVVAKRAPKSLKDQAADLIPQNANKNRVTLRSPSQKMEVDLSGRAHGDVPTPHTKVSPRNLKAPNQPAFNTKNSPVRPTTQQDIRTVRRFLERQGRQ